MANALAVALGIACAVWFAWFFWDCTKDIFKDHWHFMGHRVPGVCCGPRCPHHRYCTTEHSCECDAEKGSQP